MAYSEPYPTFNMEHFAKIVNGFQLLTILEKHSTLAVDRVLNTLLLYRKCSKIPESIDIKDNMTAKWVKIIIIIISLFNFGIKT